MPQTLTDIVGFASEARVAEQLHRLVHQDAVETVVLSRHDTQRRRLRVRSDRGREYLIALSREQQLGDGAVLILDAEHALVVRVTEEQWLGLEPVDITSAVELGYFTGNLHWRVKFEGSVLRIALEGPEQDYLDRLKPFLENQRVRRVND